MPSFLQEVNSAIKRSLGVYETAREASKHSHRDACCLLEAFDVGHFS